MKYTKIYIGSNNTTGELELAKILDILNNNILGYTLMQAQGFWSGKSENTAIVEIYGDYNISIIAELKSKLEQKSILVITSIVDASFND